MPANTAVWLRKKNGGRIAVGPASYTFCRAQPRAPLNLISSWCQKVFHSNCCPYL
jgi:hypothetical protein